MAVLINTSGCAGFLRIGEKKCFGLISAFDDDSVVKVAVFNKFSFFTLEEFSK